VVHGINDAGQIVGTYVDTGGAGGGFLRSGGTYTQIDIPGSYDTQIWGINNEGQVVGTYGAINRATGAVSTEGFIYNINTGTYTTLNDPLATGGTFAQGINDAGQVVGYFNSASGDQAFLYSNGTYTLLSPSPTSSNIATGINNAGEIVGFDPNGSFLAVPNPTLVADPAHVSLGATVTANANGNDNVIYVGSGDTVTVGTGQDSLIFEQTAPGSIGAVTINHFNPSKDVIQIQSALATSVTPVDDSQGNAVITVDSGDTITLVGVHAAALHTSDFHFA
jgi:probable HAF family extracellular repeat protein